MFLQLLAFVTATVFWYDYFHRFANLTNFHEMFFAKIYRIIYQESSEPHIKLPRSLEFSKLWPNWLLWYLVLMYATFLSQFMTRVEFYVHQIIQICHDKLYLKRTTLHMARKMLQQNWNLLSYFSAFLLLPQGYLHWPKPSLPNFKWTSLLLKHLTGYANFGVLLSWQNAITWT